MPRSREVTVPQVRETLEEVLEDWEHGRKPDFHVDSHPSLREGDRVVVTSGLHVGRRGRVVLTNDSQHKLVVKLLGLTSELVRVVLDRSDTGSWSGVLPLRTLPDAELYVRVVAAASQALDDCARYLGLQRLEVPISGAGPVVEGLQER